MRLGVLLTVVGVCYGSVTECGPMRTILLTGATDGIGLETAKLLAAGGHRLVIHGRNPQKVQAVTQALGGEVESVVCDLSKAADVAKMADDLKKKHTTLDVLVNNAGILNAPQPMTADGLDVRFAVNTIAPYILTKKLWSLFTPSSRVVNLSSAAQSPVDLDALAGKVPLDAHHAYAQSKLAITMWSKHLAAVPDGPLIVAVNPGSLLATNMVREGYGIAGKDVSQGANILVDAAVGDDFGRPEVSGAYFDNDRGNFGPPHRDATNPAKVRDVVAAMDAIVAGLGIDLD